MFVKITTSGPRRYVQLVESYRDDAGRVKKRTVATLGRLDQLTGELDAVIDGLLKVSGREPVVNPSATTPVGAAAGVSFETARALGNVWTLTELWKELGFSDLGRIFRRTHHTIDVEALIRIMVFNRLCDPDHEHLLRPRVQRARPSDHWRSHCTGPQASALGAIAQTLPIVGLDQTQWRAQRHDVPRGIAAYANRWSHHITPVANRCGAQARSLRAHDSERCQNRHQATRARTRAHHTAGRQRHWRIASVESKGLASKILCLAARQLPNDWLIRYGLRPVLMETFVEFERHRGTCYKAANWINIGQTAGRGKKSASHRQLIPVKDIWLYPLRKNFATALCQ